MNVSADWVQVPLFRIGLSACLIRYDNGVVTTLEHVVVAPNTPILAAILKSLPPGVELFADENMLFRNMPIRLH